jgi:hypothetical protein
MDRLIGRIMDMVGDDATIFFATAISQQPYLKFENEGGKHIYRPMDILRFARWAGIQDVRQCNPVMAEQFWLEFATRQQVEAAAAVLGAITVDGEKAFPVEIEDTALFTGFSIRKKIAQDAVMVSPANGASTRFFDLLYAIEGMKSGMHHQDGLLWIRDPRIPRSSNPRVALESVTPTVLQLLDVDIPDHMKDPSLLRSQPVARENPAVSELQPVP